MAPGFARAVGVGTVQTFLMLEDMPAAVAVVMLVGVLCGDQVA